MLVLSRKVGEQVLIGDGVRVTVLSARGNHVRLGFVAPDEVPIRREEICFEVTEREPAAGRLPGKARVRRERVRG